MEVGGLTSQPIGHYEFCQRMPEECAIRPDDDGPLSLTDDILDHIRRVNLTVNEAVTAMSDADNYGQAEFWAYPDRGFGDCEDHALEKRRTLTRAGISLANLLLTVVRLPNGEGHAILTVRTDRGDFVLDNLTDEVKLWSSTGYRYLKRQAADHTGRWISLRDDEAPLVSALR
ncbi:MAG: transglutaminase-like cysteine peptidase [Mesorhizobium sp.]|nr:transglutaminase-like cysteine peptidase [Mesorhizobium sp.]